MYAVRVKPGSISSMAKSFYICIVLQLLDFLTTLAAVALGGTEQNPLVAHIMALGSVRGLLVSKLIVIGLAAVGARMRKEKGIRWANFVFAGIVAWNLTIIGRLVL